MKIVIPQHSAFHLRSGYPSVGQDTPTPMSNISLMGGIGEDTKSCTDFLFFEHQASKHSL